MEQLNCPFAVALANRYRAALLASESRQEVPTAWKIAFEAARHGEALVIQDLLLGVNALMSYDLPFVLGNDRSQSAIRLQALFRDAQTCVERLYTPALDLLGRSYYPLVSGLASLDLAEAVDLAVDSAAAIAKARDLEELAAIERRIDAHAAALAYLVLAQRTRKLLFDALRRIEAVSPWWNFVGEAQALSSSAPSLSTTLDELISRLHSVSVRYDDRRSRLALDPAILASLMVKVSAATFDDPAWISRILLGLGNLYLSRITCFDDGRFEALPECWYVAFQSASSGQNLLVQDVLLGLNARLQFDLTLTLFDAGPGNVADFEKLHAILRTEIIALETSLMTHYNHRFPMPNLIAAPLQGILGEFAFDRAIDSAWRTSEAGTRDLLQELDRSTSAVSQRILLKGLPGSTWVLQAIRHAEDEFNGTWTEWLSPPPSH